MQKPKQKKAMIRKWTLQNELNDIFDVWSGIGTYKAYNPEHYDIVPKRSYKEKLLKIKEEELSRLKEQQKHYNSRAEAEQLRVQSEIDRLKVELG